MEPTLIRHPSALLRYEHDPQVTQQIFGEQQMGLFGVGSSVTECADDLRVFLNKATDTAISIKENLQTVTDDFSSTSNQVNSTGIAMENVMSKITPMLDDLNTLTNTLKNTTQTNETFLGHVKKNAHMIGINLFSLSRARSIPDLLGPGINLISNLGFDKILIDKICDWFASPQFKQESFDETQKLLLIALTTLTNFSPSSFISKLSISKNLKEAEAIGKLFEMFCNVLSEWGFDVSSKARTLRILRETMVEVINKLPQYEFDIIHNQTKFLNSVYRRELEELKTRIDDLRKDVSSHSYNDLRNSSFNAELMEVYRRMKAIVARSDMILKQASSRVRPVGFLFVGEPQIGKSELVLEVVRRIRANTRNTDLCEEMEAWTVWNHTATDAYHEGYIGQEIHVIDDIFSRTDHIDHADMINFISSNPYLTRQAALSDKGFPYTGKIVLASVNNLPTSSKAIENFSALKERFTIIHCQGQKPGRGVELDRDFSHLEMRISDWDIFTKPSIQSRLDVSSISEVVDCILDEAEMAENYYLSKQPSQGSPQQGGIQDSVKLSDLKEDDEVIGEEQAFYDPVFITGKVYSSLVSGLLRDLKIDNRDLYLQLRKARVRLGDREIRASDYIEQLNIVYTHDFLWKLSESGTLPKARLFYNYGDYIYVWDQDCLKKTLRGSTEEADDKQVDIDFSNSWTEVIKETISQIQSRIWPRFFKIFTGIKIAACLTSPIYSVASVILSAFTYFFTNKEYKRKTRNQEMCDLGFPPNEEEAQEESGFWWRTLAWAADATSLGLAIFFLSWFLYKVYGVFSTANCKTYCSECQNWLDEDYRKEVLETTCKISCTETHMFDCVSRKASLRRDCKGCIDKLCTGECFHSMVIHQSILDQQYLRLTDIAGVLEVSPEGKRVRQKTYQRVSTAKPEVSPEGKRPKQKTFQRIPLPTCVEVEIKDPVQSELIQGYSSHASTVGSNEQPIPILRAKIESCNDEQAKNLLASLCSLTVKIIRRNRLDLTRQSHLWGLGVGNCIICPQHVHVHGDANFEYFMERDGIETPLSFEKENVGLDLACFSFDEKRASPFKRTIMKHLMSEAEFNKVMIKRWPGYQFIPGHAKFGLIQNIVIDYKVKKYRFTLTDQSKKTMDHALTIQATQTISPLTSAGDCGGFIVIENPNIPKKLIGMHVVGAEKAAYSAVMTYESVSSLLPTARLEIGENEPISVIPSSVGPLFDVLNLIEWEDTYQTYMPEGDFEYLGDISYNKPQNVTELKVHPFKELFNCKVAPAALHHSAIAPEYIDNVPLNKKGIPDLLLMKANKYGKFPPNLSDLHTKIIHSLKDTVVERFVQVMDGQDIGPCDWDEAVGGDPLDAYSHKLKGATSAGIGWDRSAKGAPIKKSSYFTNTIPQTIDTSTPHGQKLMGILELTENLMAQGHRTLSIDKNCLKDEVRPLDKVWKPRLFKARPLDKVILKRKYFLRFKMAWTKAQLLLNHAVGINPISTQWAELYHYLVGESEIGFDADFGGFDTNQLKIFQELWRDIKIDTIKEVQNNLGKPIDRSTENIMKGLLNENIDSISSCYSNVYMDHHGNSSGDPDTTEDNSAINLLYHFFAFVIIMAKKKYGEDFSFEQASEFIDFELFRKYIRAVFFGDDLLILPDPDIGYTFEAVQNIMVNILEQDYTSASKSKIGTEHHISELTFLKRKFKVAGPSFITAPLDRESIESRFCYTMLHPSDLEGHATLVYEGLLEATCHGPVYYKELSEKLKRGLSLNGWRAHSAFDGKILGYSAMRSEYFTRYNEGGF
jgi:archaellum component FlaC